MQNKSAELNVISGLMQFNSEAYHEVADIVTDETFTDESNNIIWKCAGEIFKANENAKLDLSILKLYAAKIGYKGFFDNQDAIDYIKMVKIEPISYESVRKSANIIRKLEIARVLKNSLKKIDVDLNKVTGFESPLEILGLVQNPIFNLSSLLVKSENEIQHIGKDLKKYIKHLMDNPVDMLGLSTGYPVYDAIIGGGYRRKTVNLIGARSKVGKTFILDNIALNMNSRMIPTLNLDTEMSVQDHIHRMIAHISGVEINKIEKGKLDYDEKKKVMEASDILEKYPYHHISVAGRPFEEILSIARRWINKEVGKENGVTKDCLIMYDYMKLMDSQGLEKLQEYQMLGFQATALHNFAVLNDVPICASIQLNRDGVSKESAEVISQSDRILWLVSNFALFKKKSDEELLDDAKFNRKLMPLACRHGQGLEDNEYINMNFEGKIGRIIEGPLSSNYVKEEPATRGSFDISDVPAEV